MDPPRGLISSLGGYRTARHLSDQRLRYIFFVLYESTHWLQARQLDPNLPPTGNVVLWNRPGSQGEIENSKVGLEGTFSGGSFVEGMFGNTYTVDYRQKDPFVYFPKQMIPGGSGCIKFWARLPGYPDVLEWGNNPFFVWSGYTVQLNGNDGAGNGGLCGVASPVAVGTGVYGSWTYEQVLGSAQVDNGITQRVSRW